MEIRSERPADRPAIREVTRAAFGSDEEVALVDALWKFEGFDPERSLVAIVGGDVVGHILFTPMTVGERTVPLLSPLAVHPAHQRSGIGTALVEEGLERLAAAGERAVIVEGIPAYYPRFGFERASAHGIEPPDPAIPDAAFMIRWLGTPDRSLVGPTRYSSAFMDLGAFGP